MPDYCYLQQVFDTCSLDVGHEAHTHDQVDHTGMIVLFAKLFKKLKWHAT